MDVTQRELCKPLSWANLEVLKGIRAQKTFVPAEA